MFVRSTRLRIWRASSGCSRRFAGARCEYDRTTRISGCVTGRTLTRNTTRLHSFTASNFCDPSLRRRRKHGLRVYHFGRDRSDSRRPGDHRATLVMVGSARCADRTPQRGVPTRNSHRDPAINTQHLPCNVSGFWRCEECHRRGNFLRCPGPAEWDFAVNRILNLVG